MDDLDAKIRARLDLSDQICGAQNMVPAREWAICHAALRAVLDLHPRVYILVNGDPARESPGHCGVCVPLAWPCPTVLAIAEYLGVCCDAYQACACNRG